MSSIEIVGILAGIAIGTPLGIFLAHVLLRLWETLDDLVYDIRWKIMNRRK